MNIAFLKSLGFFEYTVVDCPLDKQLAVSEALGKNMTTFATLDENGDLNTVS